MYDATYIIIQCIIYPHPFFISEKLLGLRNGSKDESSKQCCAPPPIITHTDATPMATPQGSPNEHGGKDFSKPAQTDMSTLTIEIPVSKCKQLKKYQCPTESYNPLITYTYFNLSIASYNYSRLFFFFFFKNNKKGKKRVQGVPQSQATALPRH